MRTPLSVMVQSYPEAIQGSSALAEHQLWRVGEWEDSLTPPPLDFPQISLVHLTSLRAAGSSVCPGSGFLLMFRSICGLSEITGRSPGRFPARFFQDFGCKFPPHSAWGMSWLPRRKCRNSHVWINKRIESEGIAAQMEENTLPATTCKSSRHSQHDCFAIYVTLSLYCVKTCFTGVNFTFDWQLSG